MFIVTERDLNRKREVEGDRLSPDRAEPVFAQ